MNNKFMYILKDYQLNNIATLKNILLKKRCCIDCSPTGSGKSIVCVNVIKELNLTPLILCPLSVVNNWKSVLFNNGVKFIDVINYEKIKMCRTDYFIIKNNNYKWNLPKNTILIFDEIHLLKTHNTQISKLLVNCDIDEHYVYGLSATIAYNPIHLVNLLLTYRMINNVQKFLLNFGCKHNFKNKGYVFDNDEKHLKRLHNYLFINEDTKIGVNTDVEEIKKYLPEQIINVLYLNMTDYYENYNDMEEIFLNNIGDELINNNNNNNEINNNNKLN